MAFDMSIIMHRLFIAAGGAGSIKMLLHDAFRFLTPILSLVYLRLEFHSRNPPLLQIASRTSGSIHFHRGRWPGYLCSRFHNLSPFDECVCLSQVIIGLFIA